MHATPPGRRFAPAPRPARGGGGFAASADSGAGTSALSVSASCPPCPCPLVCPGPCGCLDLAVHCQGRRTMQTLIQRRVPAAAPLISTAHGLRAGHSAHSSPGRPLQLAHSSPGRPMTYNYATPWAGHWLPVPPVSSSVEHELYAARQCRLMTRPSAITMQTTSPFSGRLTRIVNYSEGARHRIKPLVTAQLFRGFYASSLRAETARGVLTIMLQIDAKTPKMSDRRYKIVPPGRR